jgi:hypothetical protein
MDMVVHFVTGFFSVQVLVALAVGVMFSGKIKGVFGMK